MGQARMTRVDARFDVIIVGGGPAGSSCARELVRAGLSVGLADRAAFPRDKPCAGWITPEVVAALGLDLDDYARAHTLQPIRGFDIGVLGGHRTPATFGTVVSYAIRRCEFDAFLLQRSGARVFDRTAVARIERARDGWRVEGVGEAPMLVGAGGHFCPVARLLNPGRSRNSAIDTGEGPAKAGPHVRELKGPAEGPAKAGPHVRELKGPAEGPAKAGPHVHVEEQVVVAAQELEVRLEPDEACPVSGELPELYFCRDLLGYGWCVRKGSYLNVGLGRLDQRRLPEAARAFLEDMRRLGRVPPTFPSRWVGHAYRVYAGAERRLRADGVLLAGDAAGLAYPASGEGILPAVVSGQLAAKAVLAAAPVFTSERLAGYDQDLARRFGAPDEGTLLARHLPPAVIQWVGRRAMALPWFVRHVVVPRFLHAA
jgi:flavin-dependent dehydrogenase